LQGRREPDAATLALVAELQRTLRWQRRLLGGLIATLGMAGFLLVLFLLGRRP
jgi:hypothetical protein